MKEIPEFNCRVLVIDDEVSVCDSIVQALSGHGFENATLDAMAAEFFGEERVAPRARNGFEFDIDIAYSGERGLEKVQTAVAEGRPYALIFTDMRMPPGWSGLETVRHIRQIDQQCEIIFITAYSDYSIGEIIDTVGANIGYFLKPFASDEVKQIAVKGVIDWNKAREMERLLETISALDGEHINGEHIDGERIDGERIEALLKHMLGEVCMWLGTGSGALAQIGPGGELHVRTSCGRLADHEAVVRAMEGLHVQAGMQPVIRGNLIVLPIKEFGVAVAVPGTATLTSQRVYLLRVFLEHASLAIRNSETRVELAKSRRLSAMGEALSFVVHDIRGPVTNAQLLLEYLHKGDESIFGQQEIMDLLEHSLDQVLEVANDTLDFVRGAVRIHKHDVVLAQELARSLELLEIELGRRQVPLRLAITPGLTARVDTLPLVRALRNLAVNASEALGSTADPWVEIGAEPGERGVRIWVADNGPGIPLPVRERLFEPFASAAKPQGTGLGLAVVKIMVEAHGGTISVHSNGQGTRFVIDLP